MEAKRLLRWMKGKPTMRAQATEPIPSTTPRSTKERKAILEKRVIEFVGIGYVVQIHTDFQAVLTHNKRPNHILHFILTILLFGFWLIIWIIITLKNSKRYLTINVDEFGNTHIQDH
jgi:hypothetical protein